MKKKFKLAINLLMTFAIITCIFFISNGHETNQDDYLNVSLYGYKNFLPEEVHLTTISHEDPEFWGVPDL